MFPRRLEIASEREILRPHPTQLGETAIEKPHLLDPEIEGATDVIEFVVGIIEFGLQGTAAAAEHLDFFQFFAGLSELGFTVGEHLLESREFRLAGFGGDSGLGEEVLQSILLF